MIALTQHQEICELVPVALGVRINDVVIIAKSRATNKKKKGAQDRERGSQDA
jgi:hypothetical protein